MSCLDCEKSAVTDEIKMNYNSIENAEALIDCYPLKSFEKIQE